VVLKTACLKGRGFEPYLQTIIPLLIRGEKAVLARLPDRVAEILIVVVLAITGLIALCYGTIFVNPQVAINPLKPRPRLAALPGPTSTIAIAGPPTYPPTWTPTTTPSPTATPTVTLTRAPTPTDTPTPTGTPCPTPTAPPPTPPPPSPTPTPFLWRWVEGAAIKYGDCRFTRVVGDVLDEYGRPTLGVELEIGSLETGWRTTVRTEWTGEFYGRYCYQFCEGSCAGLWYVRVMENGQPASEPFTFATTGGCEGDYAANIIEIDWMRIRD
jgi:hypothetical protein